MVAILLSLIWLGLLLFWGGFWRADQRLSRAEAEPDVWPTVTAVIPARNEAETISAVVQSHGSSTYPGPLHIVIVDDHSTDGTGSLAANAQSERAVEILEAPDLPPGWTGKVWALHNGIHHAHSIAPESQFLLLTDADIVHGPDTLKRLVSKAMNDDLALTSLMARLDTRGFWGCLLIPAFIFFFQKLYPFRWVNQAEMPIAAAAGGCVLIKADALATIGGIRAIRGALIDDCSLAAKVKFGLPRHPIWLGLADTEVISLRDNRSLTSVWTMVARTAYSQLRFSPVLLLMSVLGMTCLYLLPPALFLGGLLAGDWAQALGGSLATALMLLAYMPTIRLYRLPRRAVLGLPLAAVLYTAMTVASAVRHWRGTGGQWKGRTYPSA